ncbi:hypothetical protein [Mycolicibacterium gilvum]|uniref:hypothetical protein n=1 Tax=Mycolicibacterium gilvum TaxID=1804 RepID=UPI0040454681
MAVAFTFLGGLLSTRLHLLVLCALYLKILIPLAAVPAVMSEAGGLGGVAHPSNFVLLGGLLGASAFGKNAGGFVNRPVTPLLVSVILLSALASVVTVSEGYSDRVPALLANVSLPLVYALVVAVAVREDPANVRRIGLGIVAIFVIEVLLMYVQYATGQELLWSASREAYQPTFNSTWVIGGTREIRPYGTLGAGLEAGALVAGVIPLLSVVRNGFLRTALLLGFVGGVLITASRVPALIAGLAVLYLLFNSGRSLSTKLTTGAVAISGVAFLWSTSSGGLIERTTTQLQDGSYFVRVAAYDYAFANWAKNVVAGGGYTVGSDTMPYLGSSLENAYLIMIFDFGLIFTLGYVFVQALAIIRGLKAGSVVRHFAFSGMLLSVMALSSSGLANASAWAPLTWMVLGVGIGAVTQRPTAPSARVEHFLPNVEKRGQIKA